MKYLINFVVGKTNKGLSEYVEKGLALYKIGLTENLLVKANRITENTFINIAWWSAFLKDFEFSANFIDAYQKFI